MPSSQLVLLALSQQGTVTAAWLVGSVLCPELLFTPSARCARTARRPAAVLLLVNAARLRQFLK
jgi:hypothetical protein